MANSLSVTTVSGSSITDHKVIKFGELRFMEIRELCTTAILILSPWKQDNETFYEELDKKLNLFNNNELMRVPTVNYPQFIINIR